MAYGYGGVDVRVTGRRIVATIIDGFVLGFVFRLLTWIFHLPYIGGDFRLSQLNDRAGWGWVIFIAAYYILLEGLTGRTVGKAICGIRVISARTGRAPGVFSAILRTVLRVIDSIGGYLLGWIVVLCNSRRRRLGDMAADTLVVRA